MTKWYIGTMGFSYKDWNSVFYPKEMDARNYLAYYSRIFNCVEIDSSFYGTPRAESVRHWKAVTPEGFKFCLKTPRMITHDKALIEVEDLLTEFLEAAVLLEDRLGVILFQFPPSFTASHLPALEHIVTNLPKGLRFAVEIRDQSWYTPKSGEETPPLAQLLKQYGVAWAATEFPGLPGRIYPTANYLYVRWIGQHGTFQHHDRERIDRTQNLKEWRGKVEELLDRVEAVYGFLNNDYAGFAAGTAHRFKEIAGLPVKNIRPPQQETLF